jgi:hypothetical protein
MSFARFIFLVFSIVAASNNIPNVKKSANLSSLVRILNSESRSLDAVVNKSPRSPFEILKELTSIIYPWIIAESDPVQPRQSPKLVLNCSHHMYSNIFDGISLSEKRHIVDFVPFGYDLDKLEIRLYESYDYISAFVIYEAPLTQTASVKPFYFDDVKDSPRFSRFRDKIIYLKANLSDLLKYTHSNNRKSWKMENSMRFEIIRHFKAIDKSHPNYKLKSSLVEAALKGRALGIQNDADEMILRHALAHLAKCQFRMNVTFPIYTPCVAFKKNFHYLQSNLGGEYCLIGPGSYPEVLKSFLWGQGPRLWPLKRMLDEGNTLRHLGRNVPGDRHKRIHCRSHSGIGLYLL